MPEDKRTYESELFFLQNAGLKPRQEQGGRASSAQPFQGRSDSEPGKMPGLPNSFNQHTILRLIQILKEK